MKAPKVSIITVNYQQPWVTCELLDSIKSLDYPNLECIVVDNGQAYDDSVLYKHHLSYVKVINSEKNLGFAGANNLGIEHAKGDYILLLNNDTEIDNGVIEALLAALEDKAVGAVSPVLRYFEAPEKVQYAGFTAISGITGRNRMLREVPSTALIDTPYFHGAAVMLPRTVIEACGPMPEDYFLYYEELDWSVMIKKAGYQLKVCTEVSVLHKRINDYRQKQSSEDLLSKQESRGFYEQARQPTATAFVQPFLPWREFARQCSQTCHKRRTGPCLRSIPCLQACQLSKADGHAILVI